MPFISAVKKIVVLFGFSAITPFTIAPIHVTGDQPKKEEIKAQPVDYPQGYFRNPLGIPIELVANFGELRTNHYHMGLDIRTMQRENLPVYAAADGYIRKVKIEESGFGNAIYIEHFNGYTTLYAHLNAFYPELAEYVKQKQYENKSWAGEIDIDPERFPIKKGQYIALSGNTGASSGPHLHFEIRDTETGNNVNPLLFGMGINDYTPPTIYRLYYYDRRYSTYQTNPLPIPISKGGNSYSTLADVVTLKSPHVSFGIAADDIISGMHAHVGIYSAELYLDDALQTAFVLNDISYDDTRYINGSIDYKTKMTTGGNIQHISRLPGNKGPHFKGVADGDIWISDTLVHKARIVVKDAAGNRSNISFNVRWSPALTDDMMFAANSIPMPPNKENSVETEDFSVSFSPNAFYDTMPFVHRSELATDAHAVSLTHNISDYRLPVHSYYTVRIKPTVALTDEGRDRIVMQLISKTRKLYAKGTWINNMVEGEFKYLGKATLLVDNIPPVVSAAGWVNGGSVRGRRAIAINARDNCGDLERMDAYLDGEWLLFSNRGNTFTHVFDDRTAPGRHELKVVATDIAGNTTEKVFTFTR